MATFEAPQRRPFRMVQASPFMRGPFMRGPSPPALVSRPGDRCEQDADRLAEAALSRRGQAGPAMNETANSATRSFPQVAHVSNARSGFNKGRDSNYALIQTETESNSSDYVYQIDDAWSRTLWAKPCGKLHPSLTAYGWKSSRTATIRGQS
jgi:hypothetical protein